MKIPALFVFRMVRQCVIFKDDFCCTGVSTKERGMQWERRVTGGPSLPGVGVAAKVRGCSGPRWAQSTALGGTAHRQTRSGVGATVSMTQRAHTCETPLKQEHA